MVQIVDDQSDDGSDAQTSPPISDVYSEFNILRITELLDAGAPLAHDDEKGEDDYGDSQPSSSNNNVDFVTNLPDCMIREILLRVPMKTLIRWKHVSKTWLDIISTPDFIPTNIPSLYLLRKPCYITTIYVDTLRRKASIVKNMCIPYLARLINPRLFSAGYGIYFIFDMNSRSVMKAAMWNLATNKITILPVSPYNDPQHYLLDGFAQVEFINGELCYKVGLVSVREKLNDIRFFRVELYNSVTDDWNIFTFGGNYSVHENYKLHLRAAGVNLDGVYHFLSFDLSHKPYIMSFDYTSEVDKRMEVPSLPHINGQQYCLESCLLSLYDDRYLCFIVLRKKSLMGSFVAENYFDVWVMQRYGDNNSWTKKFTTGPIKDGKRHLLHYSGSTGYIFAQEEDMEKILHLYSCSSVGVSSLRFTVDELVVTQVLK